MQVRGRIWRICIRFQTAMVVAATWPAAAECKNLEFLASAESSHSKASARAAVAVVATGHDINASWSSCCSSATTTPQPNHQQQQQPPAPAPAAAAAAATAPSACQAWYLAWVLCKRVAPTMRRQNDCSTCKAQRL